jgi:GAF domain-containing protein
MRLEPDLLVCLAAIERALEGEFQPAAFLDNLSTALGPLVPHDRLGIGYLANDRRTYSVFAEHVAPGLLPLTDHYTTDPNREARFPVADSPLRPVFDGVSFCVSDLPADPRFAGGTAEVQPAGLRSAVLVPLRAGSRVIGAVVVASQQPEAYRADHQQRLEALGRLIGPFTETIALLYRERRRQHRIGLLKGITRAIGATLDVRGIFAPLGDAIRPALDFNAMGVALLASGSQEFVLFYEVRETPLARPAHIYLKDFSFAEALQAEPRRGASPCAAPHIDVHFRTRSVLALLPTSSTRSPRKLLILSF